MTTIIDLIRPGDRVLCAVSGGMDSVYLLYQMREIAADRGLALLAAHYNHRLRGSESDRDEGFVRTLCDNWEIPCVVGYGDGNARSEAAAREARYAFLERTADAENCAWILTAHTADDQLETMLLNLARGTGLRGLAGIPPRRDRYLRPLLRTTREQLSREAKALGLPYVDDSTNHTDRYARNRLRHEAVPVLCSVNAQAVRHAAESAEYLREDEAFLRSMAANVLAAQTGPGVALNDLRKLPRPVRMRVFRELFGPGLATLHVEALHDFCRGDVPASLDLPGVRVRREQGRLFSDPEELPPLPETVLFPGRTAILPEHGLCITVSETALPVEIYDSLIVYRFKSTEIRGKLMLTSRKPGDAIRIPARGCTKKLSDLFSESGIPVTQRDQIPVLRDSAGVAAVLGHVAERLVPRSGDAVLTVTLEKNERERREQQ